MRTVIALVAAAIFILGLPARGAEKSSSESFIKDAMEGNLWEVQAGQLARSKAANPEVGKFGAMLNTEHGEASRKAAEAAQAIGITPPTRLSAKHQAKYERLSKLSGEQFDRAFIEEMLEDHEQDVAKYEKHAQAAKDATAEYAKQTLPSLRRHLQVVQSLAKGKSRGP